ncbi:hypothetical protein BCR34DRAFT_628309 [Clohesyomyces aquaticus]|uniref:DUF7820 domain-containing protein n=1 Tax=Clohesyomyces aquaticus TaxID=1231657 RepID=A0A1Y1YL52_9PLEO|nr:hypothetical protein BCR34DRAFT_628309 [Clohesyomyces aquaticus]
MDRRNSHADDEQKPLPPAAANANPNVFDDEYAVDPAEDEFMPGISDGFRPMTNGASGDRHSNIRPRDPSPARPAFSPQNSIETDLRRFASRNSTAKAPCHRESLSHDARHPSGTHTRGIGSQSTPLQHRVSVSSTGSFATMARSESPLGTGPSHPYGMYPQNTMARTSSVTTSSTAQPPRRSVSLQQPTHPYGLYPQNVVEDPVDPPVPAAPPVIPVGFPGLNTGYHRQIGPDGEEQDIVGPDGHTEQLPPYSRYPEEGPTKAALAAEASSTPVESVPSVPAPLAASNDALITPVEHPAPPPEEPPRDPPASRELQASEQGASEKQDPKPAKGWTSRKLWGKVPLGVAVVLLILVLVFAIILGAAIGTFVAKNKDNRSGRHKGDHDEASPQVTPSPSMFDAYPIPMPSSLPALPTGAFSLPLGVAQEASPGCLTVANQLSAWSCKMAFVPLLLNMSYLSTAPSASIPPRPVATIQPYTKPDGGIQWGVQPPIIPQQPLNLVIDNDYKAYGPAFHFQSQYDKVVVLSPEEFAAGASLRTRDRGRGDGDSKPSGFRHRFQVMPGETPWYCIWNQTFIEMYVYVTDNSTAATFTAFPSVWPSNSPPWGSSIPLETNAAPTSSVGGAAASSAVVSATPTPSTPVQRRGDSDYPHLLPYPRIVKIEERRLPGAPQPYCQKMRLLDNGAIVPEMNSTDGIIKVMIQEEDPSMEEFQLTGGGFPSAAASTSASSSPMNNPDRRGLEKRRDPGDACHCQWMFQ